MSKETERFKQYNVRLKPSQIEHLKTLPDAAQWLRNLIDRAIAESVPESKKVLLAQQIKVIENKIVTLRADAPLLDAKKKLIMTAAWWEPLENAWLAMSKGEPVEKNVSQGPFSWPRYGPPCFRIYDPFDLEPGMTSPKKVFEIEGKNTAEGKEHVLAEGKKALERHYPKIKAEHDYQVNVINGYEDEVRRLKEEIQGIKQEMA